MNLSCKPTEEENISLDLYWATESRCNLLWIYIINNMKIQELFASKTDV